MHDFTNHNKILDIDEWIKTDVGQYKVVANDKDMKLCTNEKQCTWMESKDVCTEEKGYLVEISSKKENDRIIQVLTELEMTGNNRQFFIGLQKKEEGFMWSSSQRKVGYQNFKKSKRFLVLKIFI